MSAACDSLSVYIAGKMTPVMQLTDTAVAHIWKKKTVRVSNRISAGRNEKVALRIP